LTSTLPQDHSTNKDTNHGREEKAEEKEDGQEVMMLREPRIGAAPSASEFTRRLERCFVAAAGSTSGRCSFLWTVSPFRRRRP
jgi:hypothetical protein